MHRRQRTFTEMLTRSLATAGLLYALFFAYAVPAFLLGHSALPSGQARPDAGVMPRVTGHARWNPAQADRFPGCVDMAQWRAASVPTTVVVVHRDGSVQRMPFEEAYQRARSASAADDVFTIGACG